MLPPLTTVRLAAVRINDMVTDGAFGSIFERRGVPCIHQNKKRVRKINPTERRIHISQLCLEFFLSLFLAIISSIRHVDGT